MKFPKAFRWLLCLLCITTLLLSSCQMTADSWRIVRLTGEPKTVTVPLDDDGNGIGLSVTLNFTDGGSNTVTVLPLPDGEAPYAVMTYPADFEEWGLFADRRGSTLAVGTEQRHQFTTDAFAMTVYANVISYDLVGSLTLTADCGAKEQPAVDLHLMGGAAVDLSGIAAESVTVHVDGAADVVLAGNAETLDAEINGAGALESTRLSVSHAAITINGVGAADIACSDTLYAEVNGAGSISYVGDPTVNQEINGAGAVSKRPDQVS